VQSEEYKIVRLANGTFSVHSFAERETFHPVIGPVAEAQALYVKQLKLQERLAKHSGEFVIWDVGLGAAANVLTVLRETKTISSSLRIVSFDHKIAPLEFAVNHSENLGYFFGYELPVRELIQNGRVQFANEKQTVNWEFHLGDFPSLLARSSRRESALTSEEREDSTNQFAPTHVGCYGFPAPHAILFDAFSPAKNPSMWTLPLFTDLFRHLDPQRPCAMPTYSRATMLRVTLLLAGFFVGVGHATGGKEETTIAANTMELLDEPLGKKWLDRVKNSKSAEPMREPVYEQKFISQQSWERLLTHPQFSSC
jgi:tRNA U34 5-methylaminomethyl-2-thiouridine-forming methyltransferase MnmC